MQEKEELCILFKMRSSFFSCIRIKITRETYKSLSSLDSLYFWSVEVNNFI